MRQIVSLIKDNQVHYALVDEDDGTIIPFADLLIPDPDRFGLNETATLGTNLIHALGLNGSKRPKSKDYRVGMVQPGPSPAQVEQPALPRAMPQRGRPRKDGKATDPKHRVQRYISFQEVLDVINQHPEGMTASDIASVLDNGAEPAAFWIKRTVENRLAQSEASAKSTGTPLPYRVDRTQKSERNKQPKRVVYPL